MKGKHWLDRLMAHRALAWRLYLGLLGLLLMADWVVHHHVYFGPEGVFGFHAGYALLVGVVLVGLVRLLGPWLRRGEDYYDRD